MDVSEKEIFFHDITRHLIGFFLFVKKGIVLPGYPSGFTDEGRFVNNKDGIKDNFYYFVYNFLFQSRFNRLLTCFTILVDSMFQLQCKKMEELFWNLDVQKLLMKNKTDFAKFWASLYEKIYNFYLLDGNETSVDKDMITIRTFAFILAFGVYSTFQLYFLNMKEQARLLLESLEIFSQKLSTELSEEFLVNIDHFIAGNIVRTSQTKKQILHVLGMKIFDILCLFVCFFNLIYIFILIS